MRIGFVWGILAGAAVVAALGWVLLTLTDPRTPTQSAVVEQPSGRVLAEATAPPKTPERAPEAAQEPTGAPAATARDETSTAGATAGEPQDAAAGSPAGDVGRSDRPEAMVPAPSGSISAGTPAAPEQGEAVSPKAAAGESTAVAAGPAEGGTAAGEAQAPTVQPVQPVQPEQLAALAPAAPAPPAGALSAPGQATAPAAGPTPRPPADPLAPSFDVVRVDASGQTVIAGRAQPEQDVEVLLDGRVVDTVRADASGRFVAVITADLSGEARQLQLRVTVPENERAEAGQSGTGQAGTAGGAPQQAGTTAEQPDSTEAVAGTAPDNLAAELSTGETGTAGGPALAAAPQGRAPGGRSAGAAPALPGPTAEIGGTAVDTAAAVPAASAAPSELALTVTEGEAAQGTAPGPAPRADGAAPLIAIPDQPLAGGSVGVAPSADGLRVPTTPGIAPRTMAGTMNGGAPAGRTFAAIVPGGTAAAGAAQGGAGGNTAGSGSTADATTGAADAGGATDVSSAGGPTGGTTVGGVAGGGTTGTAGGTATAGGATTGNGAAAGGDAASGGAPGGYTALSDAAPSVGSQAPSLPSAGAAPDQDRVDLAAAPATSGPGVPSGGMPAGLSGGGAAAPAGPSPAVPNAPNPAPEGGGRYLLSAPVLILPAARADDAPALVQPKSDEMTLLQPGGDAAEAASSGVVLHQITYAEAGDVQLRGSARPRHAVRVYGDGQMLGTTPAQDGAWQLSLPRGRVEGLSLFRVDEIGPAGQVTSRVEAPFRYTGDRPLVLRDREIVIQKGDNLWRIAEHYYGEGIRYSLIYGANSELIRDPDLIYPDQVFSIPELVEAQ